MDTQHVADVLYTDGHWRPVWEHPDGTQYIVNADGERVYGVWYIPRDPPQENSRNG